MVPMKPFFVVNHVRTSQTYVQRVGFFRCLNGNLNLFRCNDCQKGENISRPYNFYSNTGCVLAVVHIDD